MIPGPGIRQLVTIVFHQWVWCSLWIFHRCLLSVWGSSLVFLVCWVFFYHERALDFFQMYDWWSCCFCCSFYEYDIHIYWLRSPVLMILYNWINENPWRNLLRPLPCLQYLFSLQVPLVLPQKILNQAFLIHTCWSLARKFKFPLYLPPPLHNLLFSPGIKIKERHSNSILVLAFFTRHTSPSSDPTPLWP